MITARVTVCRSILGSSTRSASSRLACGSTRRSISTHPAYLKVQQQQRRPSISFSNSTTLLLQRPNQTSSSTAPSFKVSTQHQTRNFSSTSSTMSSPHPQKTTDLTSPALLDVIANRRSYYTLNSSSPIPDPQIQSILTSILQTVPSAFNMQSTRLILALGPAHHKIWDITTSLLRAHMGEDRWSKAPTASKLAGFRAAHGTVLFYEDTTTVNQMSEKFSSYADKFGGWSEHGSGMHQLAVWCALEAEGLGANLQHYNPVIDADVAKEFDVPEGWKLRAQMVFGGVEGGKRPDPKDKLSPEQTLKVFGLQG